MRKPQRDFLLLGCQNPRGNIQGRDRQAETEATFSGAARQISRPYQRQVLEQFIFCWKVFFLLN